MTHTSSLWTTCSLSAALTLVSVGCAPDSAPPDIDDDAERRADRIVGGEATSALPAVGALTRFGSTHCTATLVGPRKVLTAAHCLRGLSPSQLRFALGPRVSAPEHVIRVASLHPHPNYNPNTLRNDIGYAVLETTAPVAPMAVVSHMDQSWEGRELIFVGYGNSNGFDHTGAGTKRFVAIDIERVDPTQFTYREQGKNTCNGDSGGPAFNVTGNGQTKWLG